MMYEIVIERQAAKQLALIPSPYFEKIAEALKNLAVDPRPYGYKKLKGRHGYRYRVNNYRIIYNINDKILTVFIVDIGDRKNVYD